MNSQWTRLGRVASIAAVMLMPRMVSAAAPSAGFFPNAPILLREGPPRLFHCGIYINDQNEAFDWMCRGECYSNTWVTTPPPCFYGPATQVLPAPRPVAEPDIPSAPPPGAGGGPPGGGGTGGPPST